MHDALWVVPGRLPQLSPGLAGALGAWAAARMGGAAERRASPQSLSRWLHDILEQRTHAEPLPHTLLPSSTTPIPPISHPFTPQLARASLPSDVNA